MNHFLAMKQPKPKLCKWEPEQCEEKRVLYAGKSILSPFCKYHLALSHIYKKRIEVAQNKAELEKVRQESKKCTPREQFYHSAAWKWFSRYILLFYSDENFMVRCSTNPQLEYKITNKLICGGHFIKVFDANSSNYSTALDFRNVLPQSDQENRYNNGNEIEMEKAINRIHGEGTSDLLKQKKHEAFKLDKYELDLVAKKYRFLFKEELIRRGKTNPWKN